MDSVISAGTRVAVVTLGCKTNQFESASMQEQLTKAGCELVDFAAGADLVIVNTCTVTAATDAQSRNLIRRARRHNPAVRIVVTGCYAQVNPEPLRALPGVSLIIGNEEKTQLMQLLRAVPAAANETPSIRVADIRSVATCSPLEIHSFTQRSRAFVQIQNGCDAFCSYCIIPYARGASRSVPIRQVIDQINTLEQAGYHEIVLTGIHIGGYGRDLQPRIDLLQLLETIEQTGFNGRLRLGSIEPTELPDELCRYILQSDWICPHLHIPLQSGDNDILRLMNRDYDTGMFSELLQRLCHLNTDVAIGVDVICGFPGETDARFATTMKLLQEQPISYLHVFPYSRRPGTPAAQMTDQVGAAIIKDRAARLRALSDEKQKQFRQRFIGRELDMVIEKGGEGPLRKGVSENYIPLLMSAEVEPKAHCRGIAVELLPEGLLVRPVQEH